MSLNSLMFSVRTRYKVVGEIDDLNRAVELGREALSLCPQWRRDRSTYLNRLSSYLSARYKRLGEIDDITEAIVLAKDALSLCPLGHQHRAVALNALAFSLCARYDYFWEIEDLDEAIKLTRDTLSLCTPDHLHQRMYLKNLASYLCARYNRLGELDDLNEAIALGRDTLSLLPPGHPDLPESSDALASYLFNRYNQFGRLDDLNDTIVLVRDTLSHCLQGDLDQPVSSHNLAFSLSARFKRFGELRDLIEAIALARGTLPLFPQGHSDRLTFLENLSSSLRTGYERLGQIDYLNEAIVCATDALSLCPQGHLDRLAFLNNLSLSLCARYEQLGEIDDIDKAVVHARDALSLCPPGHPDRSTSLNDLSSYLHTRFKQLWRMADLEEAIILSREALSLRPPDHPDRSTSLNNLASYFSSRHKQLGGIDDLHEAIVLGQEALSLRPPDRSRSVNDLADCLFSRYTQLTRMGDLNAAAEDKQELFTLYTGLEHASNTVSFQDLSAAKAWVTTAENFHHPTTLLAYETALRLLVQHLAALPSSPQHLGLLKSISSSLAVDAFSACLRNRSPTKAVELLEQGRAVFWSQLIRLRSPLDDIVASFPQSKALAEECTRLTSLVRNVLDSPGPDKHDRVCHLNLEIQEVVSKIRELPGCSRFLLPSLFTDLQRAARDGPVIIMNASSYSCDALVVLSDEDPVHIPLTVTKEHVRELSLRIQTLTGDAKRMDMKDTKKEFMLFLQDLWDRVVSRIVGFLETKCPSQSRICWCPTAEFSLLPLHAAAPFRKDQKGVSDLFVSSYTTTLTALIHARRPMSPGDNATEKKHFVAIGEAVGKEISVSELDNIGELVDGLATFTRIGAEKSCVSTVTDELGKNEWVHFACNGYLDQEQPLKSAFSLHDGPLTIQHIIQCEPQNPEFAYLSAAHTTVGDKENLDEAIHLASAMHFAGFRSVIGTMGATEDADANKIASAFYKHMVDESGRLGHTRAAFALRNTLSKVDAPIHQRILYIHIGA